MDRIDRARRSANMRSIRSRDTRPELIARKAIFARGLRYRLHRPDLPGRPDIVLPRHGLVIFVHGCFWHRHNGCRHTSTPATRKEFWQGKFDANVARDERVRQDLENMGWRVEIIWECATKKATQLERVLDGIFGEVSPRRHIPSQ